MIQHLELNYALEQMSKQINLFSLSTPASGVWTNDCLPVKVLPVACSFHFLLGKGQRRCVYLAGMRI